MRSFGVRSLLPLEAMPPATVRNLEHVVHDLKHSNYFRAWGLTFLACFIIFWVGAHLVPTRCGDNSPHPSSQLNLLRLWRLCEPRRQHLAGLRHRVPLSFLRRLKLINAKGSNQTLRSSSLSSISASRDCKTLPWLSPSTRSAASGTTLFPLLSRRAWVLFFFFFFFF